MAVTAQANKPTELKLISETNLSSEAQNDARLLLLRFSGDLTTKADSTRRRMTARLVENLRASIKASGRKAKVRRDRNRVFVELAAGPGPNDDEMAIRLARVFGIESVSLTHVEEWSCLEDVVSAGKRFGEKFVRDRRFAVRARRVGDRREVPLRSPDIERDLGEALRPLASRVDLTNPEATIFVEVDAHHAYYFVAKDRASGGLPLGVEGRAVSLLSGGFDSPVASWRLLRRGVSLDYVFCNLGGRTHQLETLTIAKRLADLWQCGTRPRFHAIDFDPVSREIQAKVTMRYWQIILKRMMLRSAEAVAARYDAAAIVTGEAIGQVSSQTLQNLSVIAHGAKLPILRPLVGNNKNEIIAESRIVGTHDLSAKVGEYCAIVPSRPSTAARLNDILEEEAKMDMSILEEVLETRSEFLLADLDLDAWDAPDLSTKTIAPGDTVIDLRTKAAFEIWHYAEALFLDFPSALRAYGAFNTDQTYVLYCEFGLKSAHLADLMRRAGLNAHHVSGGAREVQRIADRQTS